MKAFAALLRREYWEHKGSMLYTPAVMIVVFVVVLIISLFTAGAIDITVDEFSFTKVAPEIIAKLESLPVEKREILVQGALHSLGVVFGFVLLLISLFYALGCLYDERKDKSILFWKSLPISDTSTVLSKFLTITLVTPVFYFCAISIFQLIMMLFFTVEAWIGGSSGALVWQSSSLLLVMIKTLFSLIVASLWLSPLWAWCMLASSWAKKVAFLWGTLPIVLIIAAEGWIFYTAYFGRLVGDRIAEAFAIQNSFIAQLTDERVFSTQTGTAFESLFTLDFIVGLGIAALFLVAAIFTRRFKDES